MSSVSEPLSGDMPALESSERGRPWESWRPPYTRGRRALSIATQATMAAGTTVARGIASGAVAVGGIRAAHEHEIVQFFLDGSKYGYPGTDGSWCSNLRAHNANNHPIVGLLCADRRHPYPSWKRRVVLFITLCYGLFISSLLPTTRNILNSIASGSCGNGHSADQLPITIPPDVAHALGTILNATSNSAGLLDGVATAVLTFPVDLFVDNVARCTICHRTNICVRLCPVLGGAALVFMAFLAVWFFVAALVVMSLPSQYCPLEKLTPKRAEELLIEMYRRNRVEVLMTFVYSRVLNYLQPYYLGLLSWTLASWEGCFCLPQMFCCGDRCPPKVCPLLTICPLSCVLSWFGLGGTTYDEDRAAFQLKYPSRVAIDDWPRFEDEVEIS